MTIENTTVLPVTSILSSNRLRQDLGDIASLADSIRTLGLIQPVVVRRSDFTLVAGGRRLAACKILGWQTIPVTYKEDLDDAGLRELELEENVRRKEMTWQERCLCIAEIHRLKKRKAGYTGDNWSERATGELLGCSGVSVNYALSIAERITANDTEVLSADGFTDALRVLVGRKEDAARSALVALSMPIELHKETIIEIDKDGLVKEVQASTPQRKTFNLSSTLHNIDCLTYMASLGAETIDHIITDPPYGIDMDMLEQENTGMGVSSVRKEHDVVSNKNLLSSFLPEAFRVLRPNSFMCLWYDNCLWEFLYTRALSAGFKVQRWPFVWAKPSAMNQSAQYNFTKATEFCMILRKGNATLAQMQQTNLIIESNSGPALFDHPFAKPYAVWRTLLEAVSLEGQLIFDPFAGAGSCPQSALILHRKFLACEVNTEHFNKMFLNMKDYITKLKHEVL